MLFEVLYIFILYFEVLGLSPLVLLRICKVTLVLFLTKGTGVIKEQGTLRVCRGGQRQERKKMCDYCILRYLVISSKVYILLWKSSALVHRRRNLPHYQTHFTSSEQRRFDLAIHYVSDAKGIRKIFPSPLFLYSHKSPLMLWISRSRQTKIIPISLEGRNCWTKKPCNIKTIIKFRF